MTHDMHPIILNPDAIDPGEAYALLVAIAEQPIPGERGFARHYATDASRFIRQVRQALTLLGLDFHLPEHF